jgi:aerobic carbon-monoxide dehydrogenase medium subunit
MKAARFDYIRPGDVADALAALGQAEGAKLLAGGQSLGPMLNLRLVRPTLLVDVSRLEALQHVEDTGRTWRIGAGVTHARLEDARGRLSGGEMLCEVASAIAYRSVRNRGTIGGSLAHADPAADWPLALAALGASVNLRGSARRSMLVARFIEGAFTTALAANEIIETVEVPKLSRAARYGFYKFCRKTGEFAEASAAAVFDAESGAARIFLGSLRGVPQPLAALAQQLAQHGESAASTHAISEALAQSIDDLDAVEHAMAVAAVTRALAQVFAP